MAAADSAHAARASGGFPAVPVGATAGERLGAHRRRDGLGPLGAAFFLWDKALKRGDPRQIGILSYITPLASTVLLMIASGKALSWSIALAATLIVGGAVVGSRAQPVRD